MLRICTFGLTQMLLISAALAQATTTAPGTTAPATDTGFNPLWLLILVALVAAAAWYFMRRRSANAATTAVTDTLSGTRVYERDKP